MRLPLLALLLTTPALAADPPAKPNPGANPLDRALQQLGEKLTRPKPNGPIPSRLIPGMTLPSPHYLQHYPTYFPPDQPSLVPELVVPPEPMKYSDPPASRKVREDANPLLGTWVRDRPGIRVTLKFTDKRLFASLQMAKKPEGKDPVETGAINLDADYGVGPGGRVFGVVTGVDLTASEGGFAQMGGGADSLQSSFDELLFTFRARVEDDTLTVAGLKAEGVKEISGFLPLLLGKFRRADGSPLPPIKPTKFEYQRSEMTLPSPNYRNHYPTYFPPERSSTTTGQIIGGMLGSGLGRLIGSATGNPKTESILQRIDREEAPPPREVPVAAQMICHVEPNIQLLPNTTKNGEKTALLIGKLYLFGADQKPTDANGALSVVMHDITPRPAGQKSKIGQHIHIDAATLKRIQADDERFGRHYTFPLSWPTEWTDVTHVTITACYKQLAGDDFVSPLLTQPDIKLKVVRE